MTSADAASTQPVPTNQRLRRLFWSWLALTLLLVSVALIIVLNLSPASNETASAAVRSAHRKMVRAIDASRRRTDDSTSAGDSVVMAPEPPGA